MPLTNASASALNPAVIIANVSPVFIFAAIISFVDTGIVLYMSTPSPSREKASMLAVLLESISLIISSAIPTPNTGPISFIPLCIEQIKKMRIGGSTHIIPACISIVLFFNTENKSFLKSAFLTSSCFAVLLFELDLLTPPPSKAPEANLLYCHEASKLPNSANARTIPMNAIEYPNPVKADVDTIALARK